MVAANPSPTTDGTPQRPPAGLEPGGRFWQWRPSPPRYVLSDVDGTLLGVDHDASAEIAAAVAQAVGAGVRVGLATGRTEHACLPLMEQLGAHGPHVVENGAEVRAEGRVLATWSLHPGAVDVVDRIVNTHGLYVEWYVEDGYWASADRPEVKPHWAINRRPPTGFGGPADLGESEIIRATIVAFGDDDVHGIINLLRNEGLSAGASTAPALPGGTFINVTNPKADKGNALVAAAQAVDVDLSQVVAIGDGDNDRPMMAVAGTAIAMGQAGPEVKADAHLVAPEFDAEGAAHALRAVAGMARPYDAGWR